MSIAETSAPDLSPKEILDRAGDVAAEIVAEADALARRRRRTLDGDVERYKRGEVGGISESALWRSRTADVAASLVREAEGFVQDVDRSPPEVFADLIRLCADRLESPGVEQRPDSRSAAEREGAISAVATILRRLLPLFVPGAADEVPESAPPANPF